jgi:hypothetical protein
MTLPDQIISKRENLLNRILNNDPDINMLQDHCSSEQDLITKRLGEDLKNTLNQIKSLAISDDGTQVNFQQLARDPIYQHYRELTCKLKYFNYENLTNNDARLAFWINLYNSLIIDSVIQNDIKASVTESRLGIVSFFQNNAYEINHQRFSLLDIEHGVLRANSGFPYFPGDHFAKTDPRINAVIPKMDPRIHFALNCASKSCPPIGIYTPELIQDQLNLAAANFINNDIQVLPEKNELSVSRIFRWYLNDFGGKDQLARFIAGYITDQNKKEWLQKNQSVIKINFHPYDWKLNTISP